MAKAMTQAKFTIEAEIVSALKSRCTGEGASMASAARSFMIACRPTKGPRPRLADRRLRKKAVAEAVRLLDAILGLESEYRDRIPVQSVQRYEAADHACSQPEEAISILDDAF